MFKSVFVIAVLLVVKVLATPLPEPHDLIQVIALEEPCVVQGGLCVRHEDCRPSDFAKLADLCPRQRHLGVTCCYLQ